MKKQVFRLGENAFFCNSTCYVLMKLAQRISIKVPEHLQERSMTYQFKVPEHLQERSMTYHFKVPEHLQERSMTYQFKVPEQLQERSMTYQFKVPENLPSKFTWTLTHAPPHPTPPHPCLHAHNGTHRDESTYLASSHER